MPGPRTLLPCLLAALATFGCGQERRATAPAGAPDRVLLISIDTLRRDHLGCYGYPRAVSPHLDALARRGALYSDMMSVGPWTLPSHTSLLTGLYPASHRVREDSAKLPGGLRTVAEAYRDGGYSTLAVVSHDYVSSVFGLDRGFDTFDDSMILGFRENPGCTEVIDRFLATLADSPSDAFFAFLHFFDPHWTYVPPSPYSARLVDPDYAGDIDGEYEGVPSMGSVDLPGSDLAHLVDLYDAEILHLDAELGRLFRELERKDVLEGMLTVFTADHGEEFAEHGGLGHGRSLFEDQLRIPLIVAGHPRFRDPAPRDDPASLVDVAPTLVGLLPGADATGFEGLSLLARNSAPGERLRFAETIQFGSEISAVRLGSLKWIRTMAGEAGFDLASDPAEKHALREDPTGNRLRAALTDYGATANQGWHFKLVALTDQPLRCRATVRVEGRILPPDRYFSGVWSVAGLPKGGVEFQEFELSPDGTEFRFDATVSVLRGEIVFETDPPDAPILLEISIESRDEQAAVIVGAGAPIPTGRKVRLERADSRTKGLPRGYPQVPTGCYIRSVDPPERATLPDATVERLRTLGYVQ